MDIPAFKFELTQRLVTTDDDAVLTTVKRLLEQDQDASRWMAVLSARAARSDADFKSGLFCAYEAVDARFEAARTARS